MTVLGEALRGGAEKAREAGVSVVGGHSIDDAEPKLGYAVVGLVHPGRDLAERRRPAGRRARPHEAARHRHHLDGHQAGEGAGAGGDGGDPDDGHAESVGGRGRRHGAASTR